jgi:hypothetical protein
MQPGQNHGLAKQIQSVDPMILWIAYSNFAIFERRDRFECGLCKRRNRTAVKQIQLRQYRGKFNRNFANY